MGKALVKVLFLLFGICQIVNLEKNKSNDLPKKENIAYIINYTIIIL